MRSKKAKIKKANIFIALNILFILGCCLFYGGRLIYFYKVENPKIREKDPISKVVTVPKNVVKVGDGLYKEDNVYVYKGKAVNNYLYYSGRIWRIVSVDKKNNIKLISDQAQTSLVFGIASTYEESYLRSWLNDDSNKIKSFYQSLNNIGLLVDTETCSDVITDKKITCKNYVKDKVGQLSVYEYNAAGGEDSYLNIGEYWWTSNVDSNNTAWYIYSKGSVNNNSFSGETYYAYGVRPTITIDGNAKLLSGDGTKDNPYKINSSPGENLSQKYVGEYLTYNDYTWRIIEQDEEYTKVVMDGYIKNGEEDYLAGYGSSNYFNPASGIGAYLNQTFYNSLENKEYIIKHDYNTGRYDKTYSYDFNKIAEYVENSKVGLLQLGELFVTDADKFHLATRTITTDGTIYQVLENGKIFAGLTTEKLRIRPTIYLTSDIEIESGKGTKSEPYRIG